MNLTTSLAASNFTTFKLAASKNTRAPRASEEREGSMSYMPKCKRIKDARMKAVSSMVARAAREGSEVKNSKEK